MEDYSGSPFLVLGCQQRVEVELGNYCAPKLVMRDLGTLLLGANFCRWGRVLGVGRIPPLNRDVESKRGPSLNLALKMSRICTWHEWGAWGNWLGFGLRSRAIRIEQGDSHTLKQGDSHSLEQGVAH